MTGPTVIKRHELLYAAEAKKDPNAVLQGRDDIERGIEPEGDGAC
jgi:hypothetical protein